MKKPAKPSLLKVDLDDRLTIEQVRALIPQVTGCTIDKDTSFHNRWKGKYPRAPEKFPKIATQAFSISSDTDALRYVVAQLWKWHQEETGEQCPFPELQTLFG